MSIVSSINRLHMQVNMASRMESTGMPEMIQISQTMRDLLMRHYPEFTTTERGNMDIKVALEPFDEINMFDVKIFQGKGMCTTFWLDGKRAVELTPKKQRRGGEFGV
jgi:hypothetical protein